MAYFRKIAGEEALNKLSELLKQDIVKISEVAFKKYAEKHGCKPENLSKEWMRFKRILEKHL